MRCGFLLPEEEGEDEENISTEFPHPLPLSRRERGMEGMRYTRGRLSKLRDVSTFGFRKIRDVVGAKAAMKGGG